MGSTHLLRLSRQLGADKRRPVQCISGALFDANVLNSAQGLHAGGDTADVVTTTTGCFEVLTQLLAPLPQEAMAREKDDDDADSEEFVDTGNVPPPP